jgi:hypothetical protein
VKVRAAISVALAFVVVVLGHRAWPAVSVIFGASQRLAGGLPVPRGATLVRREIGGEVEGSRLVEVIYRLPRATTQADVTRFYETRLGSSWTPPNHRCGAFVDGHKLVLPELDAAHPRRLVLLVDANGAHECSLYDSMAA